MTACSPEISVRHAVPNDSLDIFHWRNDPITRQMSHETKIIDLDDHNTWFSNSLVSKRFILLICENEESEKISLISFKISQSDAVISINLNPTQRGNNLAKPCLVKSIDFFSEYYCEVKRLVAEIKEENIPSQKTFAGIGFDKYSLKDNIGFYEKVLT